MPRDPARRPGISARSPSGSETGSSSRSADTARAAGRGGAEARSRSPRVRRAPAAPDVDADEQEQPHAVDEMPVPGCRLEAEMLLRPEVALIGANEADDQEDRADDDVRAVEARRHEEGRGVDILGEVEGSVGIFIGLDAGEQHAEQDRAPQALDEAAAVAVDQRMV